MKKSVLAIVAACLIFAPVHLWKPAMPVCQAIELVNRSDFEFPDDRMKDLLDKFGLPQNKFGYTADEMANFYNTSYKLRLVDGLFRDVTMIPRFSGRFADLLNDNKQNLHMLSFSTMSLLDAGSGRGEVAPADWGIDWIPAETKPADVLEMIMKHDQDAVVFEAEIDSWKNLPEPVQTFATRMIIAGIKANTLLKRAYNFEFFEKALGGYDFYSNRRKLYDFLMHPFFWDVSQPENLKAIDNIDLKYLSYADSVYFAHVTKAIDDIRVWLATKPDISFKGLVRFKTEIGWVSIQGSGDDTNNGGDSLIIDLGGNDIYKGTIATPINEQWQIGTSIDFSGNDSYDGGSEPAQLACGLFGISLLADLDGDDTYKAEENGIGAGVYGSAMLADYAGNDTYESGYYTQATAVVGSGMLLDLSGDDGYEIKAYGQAFANTLGAAILFDATGNDRYTARDDGNPVEIYNNASLSFSLGSAQGRRADFGDGHNLAGGVGIAADMEGNDTYFGGCYTQGNSYWWGIGILEDRKGNDTYRCLQYSQGSAPHFSIGCLVDFEGNDKYNVGNDKARFQYQGHGRDGSVGIFYDGSGNDQYYFRNLCAGCADLNSIAIFWDRLGDDVYEIDERAPYDFLGSCGTVTKQPKYRTFRDTMRSIGLFVDSGGKDTYTHVEDDPKRPNRALCVENSQWWQSKGPYEFGHGIDDEWYK